MIGPKSKKIFLCNNFEGHYPVGTAAVVVAYDAAQASFMLEQELDKMGLKQKIRSNQFKVVDADSYGVYILSYGNY